MIGEGCGHCTITLVTRLGTRYSVGMTTTPFVVYLRVSTNKQGEDGLGMDAQRAACGAYVQQQGGTVLSTFLDVASGKGVNKGLKQAIALCEGEGAVLVVSSLDRLGRDVEYLAGIIKRQRLVVVDRPSASEMELLMLAMFAQTERERIRVRTRAALAEAKKRGTLLGSARPGHWAGREERRMAGAVNGAIGRRAAAARVRGKRYERVLPAVVECRSRGLSIAGVARALTDAGIVAPSGKAWTRRMVQTCLMHAGTVEGG